MKKVEYLGKIFEVPDWARYITKDEHCEDVWVFERNPSNDDPLGHRMQKVGRVDSMVQRC